MPIPKPRGGGETEEEYHSRCMRAIHDEYPQDRANAICYQTWRDSHGKVAKGDTLFAALRKALAEPLDIEELLGQRSALNKIRRP